MMKRKEKHLRASVLICASVDTLSSNGAEIVVPERSTLSTLLHHYILENDLTHERLYGPNGLIRRVHAINPEITHPDRILPGMIIRLPDHLPPPRKSQVHEPEPTPSPTATTASTEAPAPSPSAQLPANESESGTPSVFSIGLGMRWGSSLELVGTEETKSAGIRNALISAQYRSSAFMGEIGLSSSAKHRDLTLGPSPWLSSTWVHSLGGNWSLRLGGRLENLIVASSVTRSFVLEYEQRSVLYASVGPSICHAFGSAENHIRNWEACAGIAYAPWMKSRQIPDAADWNSLRGHAILANLKAPALWNNRLSPEVRFFRLTSKGGSSAGDVQLEAQRFEVLIHYSF